MMFFVVLYLFSSPLYLRIISSAPSSRQRRATEIRKLSASMFTFFDHSRFISQSGDVGIWKHSITYRNVKTSFHGRRIYMIKNM